MNNAVVIISHCMKVEKISSLGSLYHFHFKGVYAGEALRKVILQGEKDCPIRQGEEYLLYVQLASFKSGVLKGRIIKWKPLEGCWDRS